jgi:hypothetical protein
MRSLAVGCKVRRSVLVSWRPVRYGWLLYAAAVPGTSPTRASSVRGLLASDARHCVCRLLAVSKTVVTLKVLRVARSGPHWLCEALLRLGATQGRSFSVPPRPVVSCRVMEEGGP